MGDNHLFDPFPEGPFTRSRLARFTGLSDEVLSHWTKEGLLVAQNEAEGSGRHKEFDHIEVQKAAVLGQMREIGCNLETLKWMAAVIDRGREIADRCEHLQPTKLYRLGHIAPQIRDFLAGEKVKIFRREEGHGDYVPAQSIDEIMEYERDGDEPDAASAELKELALTYHTEMDCWASWLIGTFDAREIMSPRSESVIVMWPTAHGWKMHLTSEVDNLSGMRHSPLSAIMIYVTRIFRDLWSIRDFQLADDWFERESRHHRLDEVRRRTQEFVDTTFGKAKASDAA